MRKIPGELRKQRGELTITTFNGRIIDVEAGDTSEHAYGMAFDIGTTSIVGTLLHLETGEELAATGSVNPQTVYGGDSCPASPTHSSTRRSSLRCVPRC